MRQTAKNEAFVIYDDALDDDAWSQVWTHFQFASLMPVTVTQGAWKIENGQPLAGEEFHSAPRTPGNESPKGTYPTQTGIDPLIELIHEQQSSFTPWIGTNWFRFSGRPYVYPANSSLTWHRDDHEFYSGAFIYYAHPEWNVQWGGELLVADMSGLEELPIMPFRFENSEYSEALMEMGLGHYIMPRPNRLVILGDCAHAITAVSNAAGRHIRASLAGFFLKKDPEGSQDCETGIGDQPG